MAVQEASAFSLLMPVFIIGMLVILIVGAVAIIKTKRTDKSKDSA